MKEKALGKINLGLKVLAKRPDGYHAVDMLMQTISFADMVEFSDAPSFVLTMDDPDLPCDNRNIAYKAAEVFSEATGHPLDVHIHIKKNIFKAAGLAGGSADGAAVLRGLNRYWNCGLYEGELEKLGEKLGSDVPFCVRTGTARATGRGELLESLPELPKMHLVLVKPLGLDVSTAWVYKNFKAEKCEGEVDMEALTDAVKAADVPQILELLGNDLESVTLPEHPILGELKAALTEFGARAVLMSGSGPTVFGIFADAKEAEKVAAQMADKFKVEAVHAETERGEIK